MLEVIKIALLIICGWNIVDLLERVKLEQKRGKRRMMLNGRWGY